MMSASPVGNFYIYSFDGKLLQLYNVYGTLLKDYIYMGDYPKNNNFDPNAIEAAQKEFEKLEGEEQSLIWFAEAISSFFQDSWLFFNNLLFGNVDK